MNLALHFLSGAITFDPVVTTVEAGLASRIVWLDAYLTNIDRTARNTNMLIWHKELWLIDHGSCLYFHHSWNNWESHATGTFPLIKDHVLLPRATMLDSVNADFKERLTELKINAIVALVPDAWLHWDGTDASPDDLRSVYAQFLIKSLASADIFTNEAQHARQALV